MSPVTVRPAKPSDLLAVAAIYAHSVRTSTATFDIDEPPPVLLGGKAREHGIE
jgi:L-amino acid N-acyltransferase YncA